MQVLLNLFSFSFDMFSSDQQSAPFGLVEVLMEVVAVLATALPLLASTSTASPGSATCLLAWQRTLCVAAAALFAALGGLTVAEWPPPLVTSCVASVRSV